MLGVDDWVILDHSPMKISFHVLPREVVIVILSYLSPIQLSSCSRVCTKWNSIISNEKMWTVFLTNDELNQKKSSISYKEQVRRNWEVERMVRSKK
jgi:hypothetical protein